jgi:hypothetical protein
MSVFRRIQVGEFIFESAQDSIVAAGTTQATAFQLNNVELNRLTSVGAGSGVLLPPSQPGMTIVIVNHGANTVQVYGQPGDTIDDQASASGVNQMPNSWVIYSCFTAGAWYSEGLASGFTSAGMAGVVFGTVTFKDAITASTTQTQAGGAGKIPAQINTITSANANDAVTLPAALPGMSITINNQGGNTVKCFPASATQGGVVGGDQINSAGVNNSTNLSNNTSTIFTATVAGQWWTK